MPNNPPWERDELILALDLYFAHRRKGHAVTKMDVDHPDILALSALLNALPIHSDRPEPQLFRNPNGVHMKLGNFLRLDPDYPGAGLSRGAKLDEVVWNEFADNPERLHAVAEAIRFAARGDEVRAVELQREADGEIEAPEGKVLQRMHAYRERNQSLIRRRKEVELRKCGTLRCEVCGFDFAKQYPGIGEGFIECHHTIPLSALRPGDTTKTSDLALVCPNCHRMLHRGGEALTVEELRSTVARWDSISDL
jgi:5-methylcytosine-specific restriction protein A